MTEPSRGFFTHLSGTCDVTGRASLGHVAPAVAWASPHHGGSGLTERVLWWRLTSLYDGRSLRSHTVSLLLSSVDGGIHSPPDSREGTWAPPLSGRPAKGYAAIFESHHSQKERKY